MRWMMIMMIDSLQVDELAERGEICSADYS